MPTHDPTAQDPLGELVDPQGADTLLGLSVAPLDAGEADSTPFALIRQEDGRVLTRGTQPYCLQQRLRHLQARAGSALITRLPAPTLGGGQLWGDVYSHCGYRIQQHTTTGHCRLLSPLNIRLIAGSYLDCRVHFEGLRLSNHLAPVSRHAVLFLHGLNRTRGSMWWLARSFNQRGYETIRLDYPSTRGSIQEHAERLRLVLSRLRDIDTVSFVTHSMGGIVVRALLGLEPTDHDWSQRLQLHRILMICPPNQGSAKADRWLPIFLARTLEGPALAELTHEGIQRFPPPSCPFAIIAGKNDTTVRPHEAELDSAELHHLADTGHTWSIVNPEVTRAALNYIGHGQFEAP